MDKLISIIVPIFNVAIYLNDCIESLIGQTYKNLEIILVDDGSTDESPLICDEYKERDNRIYVIHKENGGLVSARKAGLDYSHGDYILNVDGDDWIDFNMCEVLINKALDTRCDIVDASFFAVNESASRKEYVYDENYYDLSDKNEVSKLLGEWLNNPFGTHIHHTIWSKLFKREVFASAYSFVPIDMSYGEDMVTFIEALYKAKSIFVLSDLLYYYRKRESSISYRITDDVFKKFISLDEYLYNRIGELYPNIDKKQLDEWYINRKRLAVDSHDYCENVKSRIVYQLPDISKINGDIILYGAGKVGNDYYRQLSIYSCIKIVAWVDKNPDEYRYDYCKISDITKCLTEKYDYILIAVANETLSEEIKFQLCSMEVDPDKIVWIKPKKRRMKLMLEDID